MLSIIYKEKKSNFIYFETLLNEINENGLQDRLQQKVKSYKDSRIVTYIQVLFIVNVPFGQFMFYYFV